ncbi:MAG: glycosyltransferase family 4 protein, partial [Terracidiphilus sp.]
ADLFEEVVIAAPCRNEEPAQDACLINRSNVRIASQKEVGGISWSYKARIVLALPGLVTDLGREMRGMDAIHVRCPGNLGLIGALLAPLFSKRMIAKYAGQWGGYPGEEWTVRLQRRILRSSWWRGPVTVYGRNADDPQHVVNFFSSMFTAEQLLRARKSALENRRNWPMTVAFSGRLSRAKNVDVLLRAIAALNSKSIPLNGLVIGDGPERAALGQLALELGISGRVEFTGAVSPERIPELLERSDIFVLASHSEGWPKAIAEAMAFGLVCVGSDLGLIRTFLSDGRGITVRPGDVVALTDALQKIVSAPQQFEAMRASASEWARGYSLEGLREALRRLMTEQWNLSEEHFLPRREVAQIQ